MDHQNQCEICPWPLECSSDMKAAKPAGADCPREARVWDRRLVDSHVSLADNTALDNLIEADTEKQLVLV